MWRCIRMFFRWPFIQWMLGHWLEIKFFIIHYYWTFHDSTYSSWVLRSVLCCYCVVCVEICLTSLSPPPNFLHPLCPSSPTAPIWFDNLFWWKSVVVVFFLFFSSPLISTLCACFFFFYIYFWRFLAIRHRGFKKTLGYDHSLTASPASPSSPCSAPPPRRDLGLVPKDSSDFTWSSNLRLTGRSIRFFVPLHNVAFCNHLISETKLKG